MRRVDNERFGGHARLEYILEGHVANELHKPCRACLHAPAASRGVGGCHLSGFPSVEAVEQALRQLESGGYHVTRTDSLLSTARYLAREAAQLQADKPAVAPTVAPAVVPAPAAASACGHSPVASPVASPALSASGRLAGLGNGGAYASQRARGAGSSSSAMGGVAPMCLDSDDDDGDGLGGLRGAIGAHGEAGCSGASGSSAAAGKAPKRPRAKKADSGLGEPKKPRRGAGEVKRPKRPDGLSKEDPLPRVQGCNYAILVAMDRDILQHQKDTPVSSRPHVSSVTFSKAEMMRLANDRSKGVLCAVDMYDGRAVGATQAGAYSYDGWSGVHSHLVKRDVPWRPLLVEHRNKRAAGGGATFSLADPAGAAAARRLHCEAEHLGLCTCGLVPKARFAQAPLEESESGKKERAAAHGLTADRASTMRLLMSDDAWREWQPWEQGMIAYEASEAAFEQRLAQWRNDHAQWLADPIQYATAKAAAQGGDAGVGGPDVLPSSAEAPSPSAAGARGGGRGRGRGNTTSTGGRAAGGSATPAFGSGGKKLVQSPLAFSVGSGASPSSAGSSSSRGVAGGVAAGGGTHAPRGLATVMEEARSEVVALDSDDEEEGEPPRAAGREAHPAVEHSVAVARGGETTEDDSDDEVKPPPSPLLALILGMGYAQPAVVAALAATSHIKDPDARMDAALDMVNSCGIDSGASGGNGASSSLPIDVPSAAAGGASSDWAAVLGASTCDSDDDGNGVVVKTKRRPPVFAPLVEPLATGMDDDTPHARASSLSDDDDNDGDHDHKSEPAGGERLDHAKGDGGRLDDAIELDDDSDDEEHPSPMHAVLSMEPQAMVAADETEDAEEAKEEDEAHDDAAGVYEDSWTNDHAWDAADGTAHSDVAEEATEEDPPAEGASAPDPPAAEEAVWEVCLAGRFEPYDAAECARLEAAYLRGEESVSVRGGLREVTLRDPPYMQRAAHAHAPCKQREVRRCVVSAGANSISPSADGNARGAPSAAATTGPPRFASGQRLRVRWAPLEAWASCVVLEACSFDSGGAGSEVVQHRLQVEGAGEEWINLADVDAFQAL